MSPHRGWIALDIDGTITHELYAIHPEVRACLETYARDGWQLIFITGRMYAFGIRPLAELQTPFLLAVQNGADLLSLPDQTLLSRAYLSLEVIEKLEAIYEEGPEDFLIYSGFEQGDFCYYRKERFSQELISFFPYLQSLTPAPWREVSHFRFPKGARFPLIKCMGSLALMEKVEQALAGCPDCSVTLIKDPTWSGLYLNLITAPQATKGEVLKAAIAKTGKGGPIIAAGDDANDISMLQIADCPIVIETAPPAVRAHGKIIARAARDLGIIEALSKATQHVERVSSK